MKRKVILCFAMGIGIWLFLSALILASVNDAEDWTNAMRVIIYGGAVTSFLFIAVGLAFANLITELKKVNKFLWAVAIILLLVCSSFILRFGNVLVVADEGWFGLYKHPFIWLLIALLIGNAVLYIFKSKSNSNVS